MYRYKWRDLLDELDRVSKPPNYWDLTTCANEALKYDSRRAFSQGSASAYNASIKNGWLENVCQHMALLQKPNGYWSIERITVTAKKFTSRSKFMEKESGAYNAARRLNVLDAVCSHMEKIGSKYERAIYAIEFDDNSVYVGLTQNYDSRLNAHKSKTNLHIGKKMLSMAYQFIKFNDWLPIDEAPAAEGTCILEYRDKGWTILNRNKAGGLGAQPAKHTYLDIKRKATACDSVSEFKESYASEYQIAHRNGWWEKLSAHMARKTEHGKWTFKAVIEKSLNYRTLFEFRTNANGAYNAAIRNDWLSTVTDRLDKSNATKHGYESVKVTALLYDSRSEFQKQ